LSLFIVKFNRSLVQLYYGTHKNAQVSNIWRVASPAIETLFLR